MAYTNQQLSDIFQINLAKWKRWSREFLPPDPIAGMQCGVAREYNEQEAFIVYLGGYLVSNLKFSIPETKVLLRELNGFLMIMGFYPLRVLDPKLTVNIMRKDNGFFYEVKESLKRECIDAERNIYKEEYSIKLFETSGNTSDVDLLNVKKLHLSHLIEVFLNKLEMVA